MNGPWAVFWPWAPGMPRPAGTWRGEPFTKMVRCAWIWEDGLLAALALDAVDGLAGSGRRSAGQLRGTGDRDAVGAENLVHVMRPGDIRRSGHRRECVFGRGTARDRPVRVAVSAARRRAGSGAAGAHCGGSRNRAGSAADGPGSKWGGGPG